MSLNAKRKRAESKTDHVEISKAPALRRTTGAPVIDSYSHRGHVLVKDNIDGGYSSDEEDMMDTEEDDYTPRSKEDEGNNIMDTILSNLRILSSGNQEGRVNDEGRATSMETGNYSKMDDIFSNLSLLQEMSSGSESNTEDEEEENTKMSDILFNILTLSRMKQSVEIFSDSDTIGDISTDEEEDQYHPSEEEIPVPSSLPPLPPQESEHQEQNIEDISAKILSTFEVWYPPLIAGDSLAPEIWMDYSVVNFILMKFYYMVHGTAFSAYVDSYALHQGLGEVAVSNFRKRSGLPQSGTCDLQPKVVILRRVNHFFVVHVDHSERTVTVFGRTAEGKDAKGKDEKWEEWGGDTVYRQLCALHGWEEANLSDVKIKSVTWSQNGYDCGPVAITVAKTLLTREFSRETIHISRKLAESCHHQTRLYLFKYLGSILAQSVEAYEYMFRNPPPEWTWVSESDGPRDQEYHPLDDETKEAFHALISRTSSTLQNLCAAFSECRECQKAKTRKQAVDNIASGGQQMQSRVQDREVILSPCVEAEDDHSDAIHHSVVGQEGSVPGASSLLSALNEAFLDKSRTRFLRKHVDWKQLSSRQMRRVADPCDLPDPVRPLWPPHNIAFDDYLDTPSLEDMHRYEDPVYVFAMYDPLLSSVHIKSPWIYFRDYGYRLLSRFGHTYYLNPPMLLENHVMPRVPEFSVNKCLSHFFDLHHSGTAIGRTGIPALRSVVATDVEIVGASDMIDRVVDEQGELLRDNLVSYFVRGRNLGQDYLCVDLERDSIPLEQVDVEMSVDVDSLIWIGQQLCAATAIALMVVPTLRHTSGIRKHNHIYIEMMDPPSEEEFLNTANRPWRERRVPISHLPHTLFATMKEGNSPVNCYIFFPRMMHRNEYTHKIATHIPQELLLWFWDHVVLKSLQEVVTGSTEEPYYEFSVSEYIQKHKGKNPSFQKVLHSGSSKQISPEHLSKMQDVMRELLDNNSELGEYQRSRFKSFFFVIECHGLKLNLMSPSGERVMDNLRAVVPQMDWNHILSRDLGELHIDVGMSYHPRFKGGRTEGVTGLWRSDFLETSFSKAGFKSGTLHHLNTLVRFGALQAEMSQERSRRTHISYRSSYNLVYEAVRKKDNQPYICGDGDAYNITEKFLTSMDEKKKQYKGRDGRNYGVRDEMRVGGMAAIEILMSTDNVLRRFKEANGVLYIPTSLWFRFCFLRLEALETAIIHLQLKSPPNHGVVSGVLMYLMRAIESTPADVPAHVRHSLASLRFSDITSRFGMMFLHDLNVSDPEEDTLPGVEEKDDHDIRQQLSLASNKKTKLFRDEPRISEAYPFGEAPTWSQVSEALKKAPLTIIQPWEPPSYMHHIPSTCGILFVYFTKSFWASIRAEWTDSFNVNEVKSLDDAMQYWSALHIVNYIRSPGFHLNRSGIRGAVRGPQTAKSFSERAKIFFPPLDYGQPRGGSKWIPFFHPEIGYITKYHQKLKTHPNPQAIDDGLCDIFAKLQCLPDSEIFTESSSGSTWKRSTGQDTISILVNVRHMKLKEIGQRREKGTKPTRTHVTRGNNEVMRILWKSSGLQPQPNLQPRSGHKKSKTSTKARNKRVPPQRKPKSVQADEEDEEEDNGDDEEDEEEEDDEDDDDEDDEDDEEEEDEEEEEEEEEEDKDEDDVDVEKDREEGVEE